MRRPPRNIEEWLYYTLLDSKTFQRFVQRLYNKINGISETSKTTPMDSVQFLYRPTRIHKLRAYKALFVDEFRRTLGLTPRIPK
ncbi:hypothetical protein TBLA_0B00290 [Henningerozyma blattae CBS 6284]|uniref:Uncharacterized protein n=1 Tax=Henningerozyma blattae (strain ATCC 34711 / CBS 6284 / DSM 70876 / NBRC 10599 / NRRL Y-10934 / UCD 77-7) TaxID=1071380 RepID=I2GXM2_HENB6|nr:hypothetical protein TBLA_0B00290 [Tetrapisispora blattae CBS 6284]CCH58874.1 hypothetical protein TBLA_0B00290 [Tetrapisispora blattae CBS 6284]